jgi:hypothetical protein
MNKSSEHNFEAEVPLGEYRLTFFTEHVDQEINFLLDNIKLAIVLPNFKKEKGFNSPQVTFEDTNIKLNWIKKNNSEEKSFGYATSWNDQTNKVDSFYLNSLIIRSRNIITLEEAHKIRLALTSWKNLFMSWLEVITYHDLENMDLFIQDTHPPRAYLIDGSEEIPQPIKNDNEKIIMIITAKELPQSDDIKKALKYTSEKVELPIYLIQLLNGLKHYHKEQYRESLLDTSTAFEIAQAELLRLRLKDLSLAQRKLIENKYNNISTLRYALKELGVKNVPSEAEVHTKIATPRNKAIHNAQKVSREDAMNALLLGKKFIYEHFIV